MLKEQALTEKDSLHKLSKHILADSHCHLDLLDKNSIADSIAHGIQLMVSDGVDTRSNMEVLKIADDTFIFPALGIDPEHANLSQSELEFNLDLARINAKRLVAIGEIGLDYKIATDPISIEKQKYVFASFLELAKELDKPVSVHARNAIDDVLSILEGHNIRNAHLHFFEGNIEQAKRAERNGYMISIPPFSSSRRSSVIKSIAIDRLLAESDAPAAGKSPMDVEKSIKIIAEVKGIAFEKAAEQILANTRRFFRIENRMIRKEGP
ncbi:MAG: TatD family hydrolase [Candidatus Micrarchaeia archaeon]